MTPQRWQRVKAVVADAAELHGAERAEFLARECSGDTALRREVESVLGYAGERVEQAVDALHSVPSVARQDVVAAGAGIGAYDVVREIGRGGMGAVYLARRADEQFQKEVAIKILKRGTDTDEVLRRFQAEREILARLEHPNIARLLDAGTTADGLPYFVMEYVAGQPITDFCAEKRLSIEEKLRLFLKVCLAVQFAHQNLIVHRDLKPGNILVTADSEPKLLDFGIAKLLATDESAVFTATAADQQRLTPGYASPEQVRGEPITTVSDVYSLGALLYELLTGQTAHRFATVRPSPTELLRVIGEDTPVRPSAASEDPGVARRLRGDLDRIVLQALRKEPQRRYPGVNAFAEDIRRYLNKFPVHARRDTYAYRTSKFIQRHPIGVAASSLAAVALVAALFVAQRERVKAVQRFNQVRELARSVLFDYHDQIAALPGSTDARRRLVQDALKYLDNLSKEAAGDRELLRELADAYERVAAVQAGTYRTGGGTASAANLGDTAGAEASQQKAVSIREELAKTTGSDADRQALARAYSAFAALYVFSGPPENAVHHAQNAIAILESQLGENPSNEQIRSVLSNAYLAIARAYGSPGGPNLGDTRSALTYMRAALRLQERLAADFRDKIGYQQGLAATYNALGLLYSAMGETQQQLEHNRKAVAVTRSLVSSQPDDLFYRRELAVQLGNIGSVLVQLKEKPQALEHFREALSIYEGIVAADPNDISVRRQWAVAHRNVGVAVAASDPAEALQHFSKAMEILAEIVAKDPKNTDFRRQWAFTYLAKSRFQVEIDDPVAAVASALEGIRIDEELVAASPGDVAAQNTLALLFTQLGASYAKWGSQPDAPNRVEAWTKAKEAYQKALAMYERLKANRKLSGADANKLDKLAREIAKCDMALGG